jgi:hypothetical protein
VVFIEVRLIILGEEYRGILTVYTMNPWKDVRRSVLIGAHTKDKKAKDKKDERQNAERKNVERKNVKRQNVDLQYVEKTKRRHFKMSTIT